MIASVYAIIRFRFTSRMSLARHVRKTWKFESQCHLYEIHSSCQLFVYMQILQMDLREFKCSSADGTTRLHRGYVFRQCGHYEPGSPSSPRRTWCLPNCVSTFICLDCQLKNVARLCNMYILLWSILHLMLSAVRVFLHVLYVPMNKINDYSAAAA